MFDQVAVSRWSFHEYAYVFVYSVLFVVSISHAINPDLLINPYRLVLFLLFVSP